MSTNATCFAPKAAQQGPPLIQHGKIVFQAHFVGWIVSGICAVVACVTSFWLVNKHLQWYTNKREQRYIVRILFMVPIYALISFASYLFWDHSTALLLIRDGYESTVLTSFFFLLLAYLSPDPDDQKAIFRIVGISQRADREARKAGREIKGWVFPLGWVKKKPMDGLYFLQMMKWGVLQYCVIRPTTTLAAVILNYIGWYCESSWSPRWGYVYITIIVSTSVSIAMYCLIQLYIPIAGYLVQHKPLLKLFAIKAVVFLTFWQATFLSLLSSFGVIKDTTYMTAADINTGISAILECFEMMLFAFLHLRAFSYKPYVPKPPQSFDAYYDQEPTRTPRLRALGHAFDFRETLREIGAGCAYIVDRMRGREVRADVSARRVGMMEDAFGRRRPAPAPLGYGERKKDVDKEIKMEKGDSLRVTVQVREEVDVGGERQWLGNGDDYAYGLRYASRREKSDGLAEAIEKELERKRADEDMGVDGDAQDLASRERRPSWWRGVYNHLSQSGADQEEAVLGRHTHSHLGDIDHRVSLLLPHAYNYDDAPPPSIIRTYRPRNTEELTKPTLTDILGPLPQASPLRRAHNNNKLPPLTVDRSDSLLARVFPHASSTDLVSASASSQSTHGPGTVQMGTTWKGKIPSNIIVTPENDPGRVLLGPPEPGEFQPVLEHPPRPFMPAAGSSRLRESVDYRASRRPRVSIPSLSPHRSAPRAVSEDVFDPMNLYRAAQNDNRNYPAEPPSPKHRRLSAPQPAYSRSGYPIAPIV